MAEALLRQRFTAAGRPVRVSSTGLVAPGRPATAEAVEALAPRGLDLAGHRSRVLDAEQVARADLIVAMARQHVREVWLIDRAALERTYTLKELVRRGEAVGPCGSHQPFDRWLRQVGLGRRPSDLVGEAPADDIPDPIGQPAAVYEQVAAELDDLCARLVALVGAAAPAAAEAAPNHGGGS